MQSLAAVNQGQIDPQALHDVVMSAYKALGYPAHVVGSWAISENDIEDFVLQAASANPKNIIEVGTFVGVSTMLLALACPEAHIFTVDPDLPLSVEMSSAGSGFAGVDHRATTHDIARRVAAKLGVQDRITFVRGGFAVGDTFSSILTKGGETTKIVGPELCAKEGPFDFAFIDGLHSSEAVAADLKLVATALEPNSSIVLHDCIGFWGASVRSGVFEFLRHHPEYVFSHPPYAEVYKSVGVLRPRSADDGVLVNAREPINPRSVSPLLVQGLARMVATLAGDRSVVEVGFGAPILENSYAAGSEGYVWSKLKEGPKRPPAKDETPDHLHKIAAALDAVSRPVMFSADLLDFASPELLRNVIKAAIARNAPMVMPMTPPGERGVAGPYSRPISALIDMVKEAGGAVYSQPALDAESERYALLPEPRQLGSTSLYASFVVIAGTKGFTDARGRRLIRLLDIDGSEREQLELQRVHLAAAYRRYYGDRNELLRVNEEAGIQLRKLERDLGVLFSDLQASRSAHDAVRAELSQQKADADAAKSDLNEFRTRMIASERTLSIEIERAKTEAANIRAGAIETEFRARAELQEERSKVASLELKLQLETERSRADVAEARAAVAAAQVSMFADFERLMAGIAARRNRGQEVVPVYAAVTQDAQPSIAQVEALPFSAVSHQGSQDIGSVLAEERARLASISRLVIDIFETLDVIDGAMLQQEHALGLAGASASGHSTDSQTSELPDEDRTAVELSMLRERAERIAKLTQHAAAQTVALDSGMAATQAAMREIQASTSWRITAPLRYLGRVTSKMTRAPSQLESRLRVRARGKKLVGLQASLNSELALAGQPALVAPVFDANRYARVYGDVSASDALRHYLTFGEAEGRWPHDKFDPSFYRSQYPDVATQGGSALLHFLQFGLKEGRSPCAHLHPLSELARDAHVSLLVYYARA